MGTPPIVGLTVDVRNGANTLELVVAGELDIVSCDQLRQSVEEIDATKHLVLDLSEVTFLDAAGLRCLWEVRERAARVGKSVVLRSPSNAVLRVLATTHPDEHFARDGR